MTQAYLRHLANFVEIMRSGSMAAAAERTGSAVSAMSRSISILENYYGFALAQRTPRGLLLTEQGKVVLEQAEKIADAATAALQVKRADTPIGGTVVISAPREACNLWLVQTLGEIITEWPRLTLRLVAADEILDPRRQRLDIIMRIGRPDTAPAFNVHYQAPVQPVLVAPPALAAQSRAAKEAGILPFALLRFSLGASAGPMTMRHKKTRQEKSISFLSHCLISDPLLAIALCKAGHGATACLEPSVKAEIRSGQLVRLFPAYEFGEATLRLGTPRGEMSSSTKAVIDRLQAALTDHLEDGKPNAAATPGRQAGTRPGGSARNAPPAPGPAGRRASASRNRGT